MPSPFPDVVPEQRGQVHRLQVHAECLEGNLWNDPSTRDVFVYVPAGHSGEGLPAVLFLTGFAGTAEGLLARGLSDLPLSTRIDRLIADGCPPFVAVLPDCMTRLGGSQFLDSPAIGAYQTFLAEAVMPEVEAKFGVSGVWGAGGRSSGGFGALRLAMDVPGRLHAVACHAGDMGFDLCYLEDIPKAIRGIRRMGGLARFHEAFWGEHRVGGDVFAAFNLLAMACAYTPEPSQSPFPARLPFDPETGEVFFDVLGEWRAHDPLVRIQSPDVAAALRGLSWLFLDAGSRDEYSLHLGARRMVRALESAEVPHVYEEFDGGHRGTAWRWDVSLPRMAAALHAA